MITTKPPELTAEQAAKAVELWNQGYGATRIGIYLEINAGIIERYLKSLKLKRNSKRRYPPAFKF